MICASNLSVVNQQRADKKKNNVRNLRVNELERSSSLIMKKLVIISESVSIIFGAKFHEKLAIELMGEGGGEDAFDIL